ncbi:MAG TPA: hypothetical protein PLM25_10720 [Limnochordia bacterium]|nr:hypothetical protein [Limnochordia bacterium]
MRAALDVGTNSVRLLVAESTAQGLRPVRRAMRIVRLGEGVDAAGRLNAQAVERTLQALEELKNLIPPGVPVAAFATSAVRDAKNGQEFARLVEERLGFPLEILSGEREAELSFAGAVWSLRELKLPEPITVVDVGGGSTEIYTGLGTGELLGGGSSQVGAVRMLERFITAHPLLSSEQLAMEAEIRRLLAPLAERSRALGPRSLVAVGGTATSLAAILQKLAEYSDEKVTGYAFSLEDLGRIYGQLGRLSLEERRQIPALQAGREDVIVCGAAILVQAAELLGFRKLYTSAWDLLYARLALSVDGGC